MVNFKINLFSIISNKIWEMSLKASREKMEIFESPKLGATSLPIINEEY